MKFNNICLVITDKCSAACDFCGFGCKPDNDRVMSIELMEKVIREAKSLGVRSVGFSGGEPFLYPELLREGIKIARESGLDVSIATNGFWGKWTDERIREILLSMRPDSIRFSYDFFHRKYIPEEQFWRAVAACYSLKIKCTISVADMNGEYSAGRFIKSLGNEKFGRDFNIYPVYRTGRAMSMPEDMFLTSDNHEALGCLYRGVFSVLYNGDVYPCCRHEVYETEMKLGNVSGQGLKDVFEKSDVLRICDVLMKPDRFGKLVEKGHEEFGDDMISHAGCSCDYCRILFGTKEHKSRMMPYVEELYGEMAVRSLLGGGKNDVQ